MKRTYLILILFACIVLGAAVYDLSTPIKAEFGDLESQHAMAQSSEEKSKAAEDAREYDKVDDYDIETVAWYRKAAEQGDALAQCKLGDCYFKGRGVLKDEQQAVAWNLKAADQGVARAQDTLGHCYYFGLGVPKDEQQAVAWFTKAAEQGFVKSQYWLACSYECGDCVPKDKEQAIYWYRKAAEQGNTSARDALRRLKAL